MTIISLKYEASGDGVIGVEFSDGSSITLSVEYLPGGISLKTLEQGTGGIEEKYAGRELPVDEEEAFRFAAACYRAEKAALRLIARAEQNSLGLTAKLERRFHDKAAVRAVVTSLLNRNLLDDERYAELWIRSRLRKAPSPAQLLVSLGKRGIGRDSSREAVKKVLDPETEYALLLKYLERTGLAENGKAISPRTELKFQGFSALVLERYFD